MRRPVCRLCGSHDVYTLKFADYAPLEGGRKGHPPGLDYFCGRHGARDLTHLSLGEALGELRDRPQRVPTPSSRI